MYGKKNLLFCGRCKVHILVAQKVKVMINPACHIGHPVPVTGVKRTNVILTPYNITLGKLNAKNSGSNEFQKPASVAITSHETRPETRPFN